jgi:ornithine decarboxylase
MTEAHFVLSKSKLLEQVKVLEDLGLKVSYSYKTNRQVGDILQEVSSDVDFSIHAFEEIEMIKDKSKISFFTQAESVEELKTIIDFDVRTFVVDNEIDFGNLLTASEESGVKINVSLRMKFQEHRIGSGKYFVYGMPSRTINELISKIKDHPLVEKVGVHIHRKSQNTSEWEIVEELEDSLTAESLERINSVNLGGGLPSVYRSYTVKVLPYIFEKLTSAKKFLEEKNIETIIEPGRFIAAPCINLNVEIIQVQGNNLIVNTTMYNCAIDCILTGTKMLVEGELSEDEESEIFEGKISRSSAEASSNEGKYYLIKGNSPTRDDIFRYKVKLQNPKVGDVLTFLNAGAYNYTTDFFGYKKLETKIVA